MRGLILFVTAAALIVLGPAPALAGNHGNQGNHGNHGNHRGAGAVYTQTQDPAGNEIVVYRRASNGTLTEMARVPTGGVGAAIDAAVRLPDRGLAGQRGADQEPPAAVRGQRGRRHDQLVQGPQAWRTSSSSTARVPAATSRSASTPGAASLRGQLAERRHQRLPLQAKGADDVNRRFHRVALDPGAGGVAAQVGFARGRPGPDGDAARHADDRHVQAGTDGTPGPAKPNPATDMNPFGFEYRAAER